MPEGNDPNQRFGRRMLVKRDIPRLPMRDDKFPQCRAATKRAAYVRVRLQDQDGAAYRVNMRQRRRRVALEVEFENIFQVVERFLCENDHVILRGLGRCGLSPRARASR